MNTANSNGKFSVQPEPSNMNDFDAFPAPIRKILRDAPFHVSTTCVARRLKEVSPNEVTVWLKLGIPAEMKKSTALTYGPDHPQA